MQKTNKQTKNKIRRTMSRTKFNYKMLPNNVKDEMDHSYLVGFQRFLRKTFVSREIEIMINMKTCKMALLQI